MFLPLYSWVKLALVSFPHFGTRDMLALKTSDALHLFLSSGIKENKWNEIGYLEIYPSKYGYALDTNYDTSNSQISLKGRRFHESHLVIHSGWK